jgi:hypothetical protein
LVIVKRFKDVEGLILPIHPWTENKYKFGGGYFGKQRDYCFGYGLSTQDVGSECYVTKNPQHMPSLTESAGKAILIKNPAL